MDWDFEKTFWGGIARALGWFCCLAGLGTIVWPMRIWLLGGEWVSPCWWGALPLLAGMVLAKGPFLKELWFNTFAGDNGQVTCGICMAGGGMVFLIGGMCEMAPWFGGWVAVVVGFGLVAGMSYRGWPWLRGELQDIVGNLWLPAAVFLVGWLLSLVPVKYGAAVASRVVIVNSFLWTGAMVVCFLSKPEPKPKPPVKPAVPVTVPVPVPVHLCPPFKDVDDDKPMGLPPDVVEFTAVGKGE